MNDENTKQISTTNNSTFNIMEYFFNKVFRHRKKDDHQTVINNLINNSNALDSIYSIAYRSKRRKVNTKYFGQYLVHEKSQLNKQLANKWTSKG